MKGSSSSTLATADHKGDQYDVFLSFRGADTRRGFTSHLYQALQDKGIHTFIDNENFQKCQKEEEQFGYIERSKIFVPIFSKGYADSERCLKEITKMVECKRLIIPVFFDVKPRDVRDQSGPFATAFKRHHENNKIDKEEVSRWRDALEQAGQVSGYNLADTDGDEATLVKHIVKGILTEVHRTRQFIVPTHPVGLDSRIAELVKMLEVKAQNDVKMVVIHGISGIGKTTLAKAVYNQIFPHFDACSFIWNIRESKLVSLQEQLLRDVFNDENERVNNIDHGISMIKGRIWSKKVLLVLDDVDRKSQFSALAGSLDWFCSGSRIIITTRDKHVLRDPMLKKNEVYELKTLDATHSLELFCWRAFGKKEPDEPPSSSHSPPPVREDGFQYDVFLSCRGPDTRKGFTSHLYQALQDKGIHTFIHNENLEKGQKVKEIFGYIERSKIFLPIFSKGYADSEWCLKEITKMVEYKRLLIPVFFDVKQIDLLVRSGPFVSAFTRYGENDITNKEEVRKWRNALIEACKISGHNLASTDGYEARLIKQIVKRILTVVNKTRQFIVAKHPVGLDSRIAELVKVLEVEAQYDVKMVGIHGMGGIGKTTLAKAVYNQISLHFDACSFISNVREAAQQSSGLVSLQEQLIRDVLYKNVEVSSIHHGINMIKCRIHRKKVLLVVDDVDSKSQLDVLAGSVDWFYRGSRIIITTRDKHVLRRMVNQNYVYELNKLDATQSLELFCWHAFGKEEPLPEFEKLSKEVAATAAGLPLALEILASDFLCQKTNEQREDMLKQLKKDQHKDIHEMLKPSFDGLDDVEKNILLDIACFFIGQQISFATFMWKECSFFPTLTMKVLTYKCLVNINEHTGAFEMHDHIRDMARKIVEDENRSDPGMRSRLWKKDDILYVLQNKRGTEKIEAMDISCLSIDSVNVEVESFAGMSQLRMLWLGNVTLRGEYGHFPRTLKWLNWNPRYLDSLPGTLPLENIVVLDLSWSSITQVWKNNEFRETKVFDRLTVLNLSYCKNLTICPDFSTMPYLKILDFSGCKNLTELDPSIGHLWSLTHLYLTGCESLKELPEGVWNLTSLEVLDVRWCYRITTLPSQLMDSNLLNSAFFGILKVMNLTSCMNLTFCPDLTCMPRIEKLDFTGCKMLTELHPSIGHLKSLDYLSLKGCESLKELPEGICQLTSLEVLDVSWCYQITTLPSQLMDSKSLKQVMLGNLKVMNLISCMNLTLSPDFMCMPRIEKLDFTGCKKLTELHPSIRHLKSLDYLSLKGCESLKELPEGVWQLTSLKDLDLRYCCKVATLPSQLGNSGQLKWLFLDGTVITALPESMRHLRQLNHLSLNECYLLKELPSFIHSLTQLTELSIIGCERLKFLPQLPCSLVRVDAAGCYEMEEIADVSKALALWELDITGCQKLVDIPGVEQLRCLKMLKLGGCRSLSNSFKKRVQEADFPYLEDLTIPGSMDES